MISHDAPSFSLMQVLLNGQFRDDPTSLKQSGAISNIIEQAIRRLSYWIGAVQCNFLTDTFDLVYLRFA